MQLKVNRWAFVVLFVVVASHPASRSTALAQSDPCAAALAQDSRSSPARDSDPRSPKHGGQGADTRDVRDLLWTSSLASRARALDGVQARPAASQDINDVAVLEDDGRLILRANPFDLRGAGVRFEPGGGGYEVVSASPALRTSLGRGLALGDDDSSPETIPFPFEFYGRRFTSLFVNSDGNLTFEEADIASTARGLSRLLGGPPRLAPFFADLDPSAGGRIFVDAAADAFTVTWCAVPGFESAQTMTVQAVLLPSGAIEFRFGSAPDLGDGIVALSPGRTEAFTALNLNQGGRQRADAGGVGERFAARPELDLVQASRRFYETHPDQFDQLVFWTDTAVISDAFAFESTVKNAIRGIGVDAFDASRDLGSAGALESVLNMDRVAKYGDNPTARILGEFTPLALLAHETGHRWLTRLLFKDAAGGESDQLLGRQQVHWSFYMDSDASVMEGNDIDDLRGGSFRTVAGAERYSRLDLYAMGLATATEVPPWFYVEAPVNSVPPSTRETGPRIGTTFTGTRRDVLIQDVIAVLGAREPSTAQSPRLHRQAFVYVIQRGTSPDAADLARLDRIRQQWEPYFLRATENRMEVRTVLQ